MSKNKRGGGADEIYRAHTYGMFDQNVQQSRQGRIERMYQRVLGELCMNRFAWSGMPPEVDVSNLERTLYHQALSVFFFNEKFGKFMALPGTSNSAPNYQNQPRAFNVIGNQEIHETVRSVDAGKDKDGREGVAIPIWANYYRVPDTDIVQIYASKFANLDTSVEINSENARQSKVLITDENMRLSVANIDRQIQQGNNHISINGGALADLAFVQALDLGVDPNTIEKLHIVRTRLWNECMGLLGIGNANQDKKERLVAAEVGANDDQTNLMRYVNLNARRQAVNKIKLRYPELHAIKVEYNTDIDQAAARQAEVMFSVEGE